MEVFKCHWNLSAPPYFTVYLIFIQVSLKSYDCASISMFFSCFRDYIQAVLRWVESQPDTVVFCILVGLYTLVSLPLAWGYIIINIATGYLYGLKIGILVTFASATLGIIIAHYIIKAFLVGYVQRLINNYAGSVLKKLDFLMSSKKDAFQLVLLSRLTPIPFGLQNSLFALSPMSIDKYLQASCLGLLPCQIINVYLGSTLRSMEEVNIF